MKKFKWHQLLISLVFSIGVFFLKVAPAQANAVIIETPTGNGYTYLSTEFTVPSTQPQGHQFFWPGLQPGKINDNIGNGVLQPVLAYTPNAPLCDNPQKGWAIAGLYVNGTRCQHGTQIEVDPDDNIKTILEYDANSKIWTQTIMDTTKNSSTQYSISLVTDRGISQEQNEAEFFIETYHDGPDFGDDFVFRNITLKASSGTGLCDSVVRMLDNYQRTLSRACSTPNVQGSTCTIAQCVVKQNGML